MQITNEQSFANHVDEMRALVLSGATSSWLVRQRTLKKLRAALIAREQELLQALQADLGKCHEEAYMTELFTVYEELKCAISEVRTWTKPKRLSTSIAHLRSRAWLIARPKGVVLIVSPWNYPVSLTLIPLISAIAAGNTAVIKMSSKAGATARALGRILEDVFDPHEVLPLRASAKVYPWLEQVRFDHIFFTGSASVGKHYHRIAAQHLTPITLELGGKCPAIVMAGADLQLAARRIAWGKLLNAGQTCVAPDYLLVDAQIAHRFVHELKQQVCQMYGPTPLANPQYPKLISVEALDRIAQLAQIYSVTKKGTTTLASREGNLEWGGRIDHEQQRMEPTIISGVSRHSTLMSQEIFGPVFPILFYDDIDTAIKIVNDHPTPLACYLFVGKPKSVEVDELFTLIPAGATVVNDTVISAAQVGVPFGGIGTSGMGAYHGKRGFDELSVHRPFIIKRAWPDMRMRYAPFKPKLISWLSKLR